jgi:hypothetical protein
MFLRRHLFMRPHLSSAFSVSVFVQTYLLHSFVLGSALLKFGAWQAFLPNLATSVAMLFMLATTNSNYCNSLGPARSLDVGPLSMFPRALNVLTLSLFSPCVAPWSLNASHDTASCSKSIAAIQVSFSCGAIQHKSGLRILGGLRNTRLGRWYGISLFILIRTTFNHQVASAA